MGRTDYSSVTPYDDRPWHALCSSDGEEGEDDDINVWQDGPELPSPYDSGDEPLIGHFRDVDYTGPSKPLSDTRSKAPSEPPSEESMRKPEAEESQCTDNSEDTLDGITNSLSIASRNLTRISQFVLKLEARAGKATKEGIRQTLDATVQDNNYDRSNTDGADVDFEAEIAEIEHLTEGIWQRLYLVDRHWRRQARETSDENGKSPKLELESEPNIKAWVNIELRTNHLAPEDTCFYTVADLADGRSFRDWLKYMKKQSGFGDDPSDEAKCVDLAWRFLDRNLKVQRQVGSSKIEEFVLDLEDKHRCGEFDEALKHPKKQVEDDEDAWKAIKKYWSSRISH
ncbi:Uu.00g121530.m01.CDS01 [Anthostomella pinea]|uniref:Uu.00g121530.m01.CDS01 n=1 Tax=Anthostomella pinea TaxID=933095 RepID=A0AAI8VGY4_9PEZI|nr:Uu.00g121530.m01.CDS01 [Anthostomella pinea]